MRIVQAVWQEFLYAGHLQCLGSVAILWTAATLFQAPFPWGLPIATYAVSYAVYACNRLLEVQADQITNPARTEYIVRYKRAHWAAFYLVTTLAAVIVLATASRPGMIFLAALFVFGVLYTIAFKSLTRFIPAFKTLYVASAFAVLVFLPFVYSGIAIPSAALSLATWVFVEAAIMQIFLDIKDIDSDRQAGLRTIPILLGPKATFRLLYGLILLTALLPFLWATAASHFPRSIAALALAPWLSLIPFRIARKGHYYGYLLESGKFVTWPVLLALGQVLLV
jgi:4-hydroxybenzoate polyprenyltransferase